MILAPYAGSIAARHRDEGGVVAAGEPILRLVEDRVLEAWIGVPVDAAARLKGRTETTLTVGRRALAARLRTLLPELEGGTRTVTAVYEIDPGDASLAFPGQVARLELEEEVPLGPGGGVWVSLPSLSKGTRGLWSLYVLGEPRGAALERGAFPVERRAVEVLHTAGDRALVRGTLSGDELALAGGAHRVVPGQLVRPLAASPRAPTAQ